MRSSHDSERTHVPTRGNSVDHMAMMKEQRMPPRTPSGGVHTDESISQYRDSTQDGVSSLNGERDVEKGETEDDSDRQLQNNGEAEAEKDPNIVDWDGPHDKGNPMNWTNRRKWIITVAMGLTTFNITFASSVFSTATVATAEEFGVSQEVMILGTSLFVLGFAVGPLIWGPASELFGRKIPLFLGFFIFALFNIPVAVAQNLQTIFLMRFFGGVFGSSPLAIVGGALADMWDPINRGVAICIFAAATFIGPVAGPIVGGFIVDSYLGWRWTQYITAIMAFAIGIVTVFIIPETSAQAILRSRASNLRHSTKNWALHAKSEENQINIENLAKNTLFKPFEMLIKEPILVLLTIYMALIYGILYLFFEAYPISFQEGRGWNNGVGALPFISITIGVILGGLTITYTTKTRFARKFREHGKVVPEERLPPMILGAMILPAGLFWFAWTSSPNITWVPQVIAGIPIGMGIYIIFMQGLNYIVDVYKMNANSAIAANTLLRSLAGGGFPLFATGMYHNLGVAWATSLLAFLCVALVPVPVAFYFYGSRLRKLSKFSPDI